jgi:hypothetical protein
MWLFLSIFTTQLTLRKFMRKTTLWFLTFVLLFSLAFFQSCKDKNDQLISEPVPDQSFVEEFDNVAAATGKGWKFINHSEPAGIRNWTAGNSFYFPPYSGTNYIVSDYDAVADNGTISVWAVSPALIMQNGDKIIFYTRSANSNSDPSGVFPDRLQLRFSTVDTIDVGAGADDVGVFTNGLIDINPNLETANPIAYPDNWTRFEGTIFGLNKPTTGRFAFRYYVQDGGASGANALAVGIDKVSYVGKK